MAETTETTPQWLIGNDLTAWVSIHEPQQDGTLESVCLVHSDMRSPTRGRRRAKLIAQAPRMLAALKAVCNDDLSPENLALVVEIIATAEGTRS